MEIINGSVYFISDCHFGIPNKIESDQRERRVVAFLESIKQNATHLFLLGDIFDFWFEYKDVVPKNNIRFIGKLAELADKGVHIYYILGNHDMWNFGYLQKEIGLTQLRGNHKFIINDKKIYIGHGDALDPKDYGYFLIKWIYSRKINQRLFAALHPSWAFAIARTVSLKSRKAHMLEDRYFQGEENEPIITYCKKILLTEHYDYFLFGHRHFMLEYQLNKTARYINVGDWITHYSYVIMENEKCELKQFFQEK